MSISNHELVAYLVHVGALKTPVLIDAFHSIDRADFIRPESREMAYKDYPIPIGLGQTISQPYTVAFMLELLQPHIGEKILDVGSGSGWTTALLAKAVGPRGEVVGVEVVPELVAYGRKNLKKYKLDNARIEFAGLLIGWQENAPFDKILVSAAGEDVPERLVSQVAGGGTMVIPVQSAILRIHKNKDGKLRTETYEGFSFVPLIR